MRNARVGPPTTHVPAIQISVTILGCFRIHLFTRRIGPWMIHIHPVHIPSDEDEAGCTDHVDLACNWFHLHRDPSGFA
ncbi:hypothetical protein H2198_003738 [Neophaeococcomyces mojaviensis]|uniref:Uncharacterized protein n=1 Tax=Neophaeococcomyces mojaviensis TaxID=3383035 RepID=A0ACC3AB77_9EURO|nr:hypothetical protein H2198_003738 [Knufia sp. JES_112]